MQPNSFVKNLSKGLVEKLKKTGDNPYRGLHLSWLRIKYYKHLSIGKLRYHQLFGNKLYYKNPPELLHGLKEIFVDKTYAQSLPENAYIIDCGANIGLSVIYLKSACPTAEILAFEPDENNFDLLRRNIEAFGLEKISLRQEAVWIENTDLKFSGGGSMASRIDERNQPGSTSVKAIRLRDLLTRRVDFLKIDIEGAEYAVIKDLGDALEFVHRMFIEYHGNFLQNGDLADLLQLVVKQGFSYYIKEATSVYDNPFLKQKSPEIPFDVQLNIFCFRD